MQQDQTGERTLQRTLPIDPGPRLFSCSPSKLSTWISCPRRFRFTYLDRPMPAKGGPWAHLSFGASTHLALRAWWDLPQRDRTPAAAGGLVTKLWVDEGFRDDAHSKRWCGIASDQVSDYAKQLDPEHDPVGLERLVAMKTPGLAFSGRVDRIDERTTAATGSAEPSRELVIVDPMTWTPVHHSLFPCTRSPRNGCFADCVGRSSSIMFRQERLHDGRMMSSRSRGMSIARSKPALQLEGWRPSSLPDRPMSSRIFRHSRETTAVGVTSVPCAPKASRPRSSVSRGMVCQIVES